MDRLHDKLVDAFLASHHGVITLREARSLGVSDAQVKWNLRTGRWTAVHRGVYRRAGDTTGPRARLLTACLATGPDSVTSHASAAWLWGIVAMAPPRPVVTVTRSRSDRVEGVDQHRRSDIDVTRVLVRDGIELTDPIRTSADLGEDVDARALDDAVDRALVRRLVTVEGLDQEVQRLGRRGRLGVGRLRAALGRRGLVAAPHPSVLESRTLRLLHGWGIVAGLALTVDGHVLSRGERRSR